MRNEEKIRYAKMFETDAYVNDGVVRWKSNNNIPPSDILDEWKVNNKPFDYQKTVSVNEKETKAFMANYRKQQEGREKTPEELYEMRAAFGEGTEVIDVFTGKITKL